MRRVFLGIVTIILVSFTSVNATPLSMQYPSGKNYFDIENFTIGNNEITSIDNIKVKPGQVYTFSMPGESIFFEPIINIVSGNNNYVTGRADSNANCYESGSLTKCTFTIDVIDEYISMYVAANDINQYYDYHGFLPFQLEEGDINTDYETYHPPLNDTSSPEFNGSAAYIKTYYENTTLSQIINNHITVLDDIDGDLTSQIQILSDAYTGFENIVGEYVVQLKATDSSGNFSLFSLTVIVKDEDLPTLTGNDEVVVSVSSQKTINDIIQENYVATDQYDGNLGIIAAIDNYTASSSITGSYSVTLEASDSSGNMTSKVITVTVVDNGAPVLNGSQNISFYMSNPTTLDTIFNSLDISDNYDLKSELVIVKMLDQFSGNEGNVGQYQVDYQVTDTSNNSSLITIYIDVIDDVAPTINGNISFSVSYTLGKTAADFIGLMSVNDNCDNLTTSDLTTISDTYSSRTTRVGDFYIELELTDNSGNSTTHRIDINVHDDQAPVIYIDNYLVAVSENASFSKNDAIRLLVNNMELPNEDYQVITIKDDYTGNEHVPGTYQYSLMITNEDGDSVQKDFIIRVDGDIEKAESNTDLLFRNIAVYSCVIGIMVYVVKKSKK